MALVGVVGCSEAGAVSVSDDAGATGGAAGASGGIGGAPALGTGGAAGAGVDAAAGTGGVAPAACASLDQVTGTFGATEWTDDHAYSGSCPGLAQMLMPLFYIAGGQPTGSSGMEVLSLADASGPIVASNFSSKPTDGGACSFTVQYDWPTPLGDGSSLYPGGVGRPECGNAHAIVTGTIPAQL